MVSELIHGGNYDEARARLLAGEQGDADGLAVLLELRDWLRAKEYDRVRKLLDEDGDLIGAYLDPAGVRAALEALESESPEAAEPYLDDPHLGAEAWATLGLLRIRAGDPAGARAAFEASVARDKGHFRARTNIGNLLLEEGQTDQAIAVYNEVLATHPDYPLAHNNLGAAYRRKGQLDKSIHHVKKAQRLQLRPATRPPRPGAAGSGAAPAPSRGFMGGLGGRWWLWLLAIVVVYLLLNRQP